MIAHIVAMARDRVIGNNNTLPWRLPEDLKNFKKITTGHIVIMGRKTYQSIGRPLPNRHNIVISRWLPAAPEGTVRCSSVEEALKYCIRDRPATEHVFIIGGGQIYRETMPIINRIYLTEIDKRFCGDTFYPEMPADFKLTSEDKRVSDDEEKVPYSFKVYDREIVG